MLTECEAAPEKLFFVFKQFSPTVVGVFTGKLKDCRTSDGHINACLLIYILLLAFNIYRCCSLQNGTRETVLEVELGLSRSAARRVLDS